MDKEYREGDIYKSHGEIYKLKKFVSYVFSHTDKRVLLKVERKITTHELWEVIDKNNIVCLLKIKQPARQVNWDEETSYVERKDPIDNTYEVNLLLDSYDEYLNGIRNLEIIDLRLQEKRKEHLAFLGFLRDKSRSETMMKANSKLPKRQYGWKLLYYHRTVPSYIGHKLFDRFCKENPDLWEKMKVQITKFKDEYKQQKKRGAETSHEGLVEE